MQGFSNFLISCELSDLPLIGRRFTWYGRGFASRIDRFLVNAEALCVFSPLAQSGFPRNVSDHCLIRLSQPKVDWGPRPFKFLNCWCDHPDFLDFVTSTWSSLSVSGEPCYILWKKLHSLKYALKGWNFNVFGNLESKISELSASIDALDLLSESRPLNLSELDVRSNATALLIQKNSALASLWQQKSRLTWFKDGDKNTSFFHQLVAIRKCSNQINGFFQNGSWVCNPSPVKDLVALHFKDRLSTVPGTRRFFPSLPFRSISPDLASGLEFPFSEAEVWSAIRDCDGSKAPGPDGFNFCFIKTCWSIIKQDVMSFLMDFQVYGNLGKGINSAFIALIPKCANPQLLEEYRPISLVSSMYKLLAKILAARLKSVLPSLISDSQTAFVKDRQLIDGVLIANEIVFDLRKRKANAAVIKLDFEKAFDKLKWDFLDHCMFSMGFGSKWRTWI